MKHHLPAILGLCLPLACAAGCRNNDAPGATTLTASPALSASDHGYSPSAPAGVANPAVSPLSDAQILEITHVANTGEIEQAKLAQEKSSDLRVKNLAAMMIAEHTDADNKGADLAKREGLHLTTSTTSATVKSDAAGIFADLSSKSGAAFDKAYVDAQVDEHKAVLGILDAQLIPNAKDGQVQTLIQAIKSKVAEHLKHAQKVQSDLAT
jgi:putative membrane protein